MKHILTTIAAVLLVGCGESQQSAPAPEATPVEPVAEAATPEPPIAKAPDIPIHTAARDGNTLAVKQHLDAGTDVNTKTAFLGSVPLHYAAHSGYTETAEQLIVSGANVNVMDAGDTTPLDWAIQKKRTETAALLRKHGGKTGEELKAQGK